MGRIKYDINVKPNEFVHNHFMVKFNNEKALLFFRKNAPELNHHVIGIRLSEWFPMTDEMNVFLKKMKFYNGDISEMMSDYTWNTNNCDWC